MRTGLQRKLLLLLLALWAGLAWGTMLRAETSPPPCALPVVASALVASVNDDATLSLASGETVRLIGVYPVRLLKEAKSEGAKRLNEFARGTIDFLQQTLAGKQVTLAQQGRPRDRYDRLLAHVFTPDGAWLQGLLLKKGFARAYSYEDNRACLADMLQLETKARAAHEGLWRFRALAPLKTEDTDRLMRSKFRFALVEGKVQTVAALRKWTFLNFGDDYKTDFTIAIEKKWAKKLAAEGFDPASLQGKRIRVRGTIESWNGPVIKLTHKEQIEVLE